METPNDRGASGLPLIGFIVGMVIASSVLAFVFSTNLEAAEIKRVDALGDKYGIELSINEYRALAEGGKVLVTVDNDEIRVHMERADGRLVLLDDRGKQLPKD